MVWKPEVHFRRSTLQRCSHDIGMLQTNLAEMEGGGEIIVADRPDTIRATTLSPLRNAVSCIPMRKIARR